MATLWALCTAIVFGASPPQAAEPTPIMTLPAAERPIRLKLVVSVKNQSPAVAWEAFLGELLRHFDRDADGSLNAQECEVIMPLPLPGGRQLTFNVARLDSDHSTTASLAELKAYCRESGYAPIVVHVEPPSEQDFRLSQGFYNLLDENRDGKFSPDEIRHIGNNLSRFDRDEDEVLDRQELLNAGGLTIESPPPGADLTLRPDEFLETLEVRIRQKPGASHIDHKQASAIHPVGEPASMLPGRFSDHANEWTLTIQTRRAVADVATAGNFLMAQFQSAIGDQADLAITEVKRNATLSGLFELANYADRNGDKRLGVDELAAYTSLVSAALHSQVRIVLHDRTFNLFPFLDADANGQIEYSELQRAPLLFGRQGQASLPRQYEVSFDSSLRSFGGMLIPEATRPKVRPANKPAIPPWFAALDRNVDSLISPREFLGPPALFKQLDSNGDGTIGDNEIAQPPR